MVKHERFESGVRINQTALPPQQPLGTAQLEAKLKRTCKIIETLETLLARQSPPEAFLEPLADLLYGIQHKGTSLQYVTFFRARSMNEGLFTHVDELKYPDPTKHPHLPHQGRLNEKGSPILYAAFSAAAAAVEISAKVGQIFAVATIVERPGHEDRLRYFPIGVPDSSEYATPFRDAAEEQVHVYLNREMSKRVKTGEEHLYNSTIAIAENFFSLPLEDPHQQPHLEPGLIYPSVQAAQSHDSNSYNVAMRPEVFDAHFHIVEVKAYRAIAEDDIRPVNHATVREDGTLDWTPEGGEIDAIIG